MEKYTIRSLQVHFMKYVFNESSDECCSTDLYEQIYYRLAILDGK